MTDLGALATWARGQAQRLADGFNLDRDSLALVQAVKLGEEAGELQAEVLGALRFCRTDKTDRYTSGSLAGEVVDVLVCVMLLAVILDVDVEAAVDAKLGRLSRIEVHG